MYIYIYQGKLCESISVTCGPVASARSLHWQRLSEPIRPCSSCQSLGQTFRRPARRANPPMFVCFVSNLWGVFTISNTEKILSVWHHISQ